MFGVDVGTIGKATAGLAFFVDNHPFVLAVPRPVDLDSAHFSKVICVRVCGEVCDGNQLIRSYL